MEYHDLVNTVQKLRFEQTADFFHNTRFHAFIILLLIIVGKEAKLLRLNDRLRTSIGCHNDDRLLEVHFSSMCICDMSIIQNLKKNIKHIRMCLFKLIKQKHTVWISAYFFAELPALIVSYISRR